MVRTQIQLTEEQAKKLKRIAKQRGISMSAMIRRSIDSVLALEYNPDDAEVRERAIAAAGRLHSGTGDLASKHDQYAVEAFSE
jgi:predicted transcriptional regulator